MHIHHTQTFSRPIPTQALGADYDMTDGERLPLAVKDLGSSDLYPQSLQHGPNGRFVTVCGDGEYVVYTALAWRNKSFGQGLEFVWSADSNEYAVRESATRVKLFKNFQVNFTPNFVALSHCAVLFALSVWRWCLQQAVYEHGLFIGSPAWPV